MNAFLIMLFVVVPVYHAYIGFRLLPDLPLDTTGLAVGIALLTASSLAIPLAMLSRRMDHAGARRLAWAGFIAMGLFSGLMVLTLLRDLLLLGLAALAFALHWPALDDLLFSLQTWSAMLAPAVALAMSIAGYPAARRLAEVRRVDIPLPDLDPGLDGFTIAQISDVHVGATIRRPYVEAIVDAVNALGADMIAVTGDLVDGTVDGLATDVAPLSRLTARHGAYFITGNHEYYSGVHGWIEELTRLGLRCLINEHVTLRHEGAELVLAGVTDYTAHHFTEAHRSDPGRALNGAPSDGLRILLAHQPRSAPAAAAAGFHLQISGHTHGGQFWPWPYFVRLQQPWTAGLQRLQGMRVYISRGTGYWGPPLRLGAPSEISLLRLKRA